jgi:hypothetical protein
MGTAEEAVMSTDTPLAPQTPVSEPDLRQAAISQLHKKRGFQSHALAYFMVNLLLVAIWFVTTRPGFFWPVFPMFGWGIGLAFNAWDVYAPGPSEERIRREMNRLSHE